MTRRTVEHPNEVRETYPLRYDCTTLREHLLFALKHEPLDLRIWKAVFTALPAKEIEDWVRDEPTGAHSRRAWYLYENLTGHELDLPGAKMGRYVELADAKLQATCSASIHAPVVSLRCRVENNLLGSNGYCPMIRLTRRLREHQGKEYSKRIQALSANVDPLLFRRAADYLYLRETKSSYAIEGERPSQAREERFVTLLARAGQIDAATEEALVEIQRLIIQDPRFEAAGWRSIQNYVGRTRPDFSEDVSYPCPKPEDLRELMDAWTGMVRKIQDDAGADPVVLAACVSFSFVYLHPFEDGNGRLHRFLIHHVLAQREYTPPGVIFPVSAVIHRRRDEYDAALEAVSRTIKPRVRYELDSANRMTVLNDTVDLYRYPDLTPHAEFLYDCIAESLEKDWPEELRFLASFDAAFQAIQNVVDMPDAKIRLMVKLLMQNGGKLAQGKRHFFDFLGDGEIEAIERVVRQALDANPPPPLQ